MNDLDRQLAELALITKGDLAPNPNVTPLKKVGPAVPPKPKKTQPQVKISEQCDNWWFIVKFHITDTSIVPIKANSRTELLVPFANDTILFESTTSKQSIALFECTNIAN